MSTFVQRSFLGLMITCASAAATTGHAQKLFGNFIDDPGSSVHGENFLLGQQITVTENFTLTDVGLIVDGNNGGSAMANIGIYSDAAGQPSTLLAETGLFSLALGNQLVSVATETVLSAGSYWYMAVYDSTVNISQDGGVSELTYYQSHSAGAALPSPLISPLSYSSPLFNYYLFGDPPDVYGNDTDDPGSSIHGVNLLLGQQISVTNDITLAEVGLIVDGNAGGSAMANIGVYTDNAGQPGILVAETGVFNLGLGDQRVPVVSPAALPAGDYWYMAVYDSTVNISQDGGVSELTYYQSHGAGAALPSPLTSLASYAGPLLNYYLVASDFVTPGDFNGDGNVDGADFLEWQRDPGVGALADWEANYGTVAPLAAASAVPEPASLVLIAVGLLGMGYRRRSRA